MTDVFVLLQLPNAGDDLQGIKKGIVELADIIVINKADIDTKAAQLARAHIASALSMLRPVSPNWKPPVLTASARDAKGIDGFWREIERYRGVMTASGELVAKRRRQALDWTWTLIEAGLRARFRNHPRVKSELESTLKAVETGTLTPSAAANRLLLDVKV
jgi:LAO/AO transport system kinase